MPAFFVGKTVHQKNIMSKFIGKQAKYKSIRMTCLYSGVHTLLSCEATVRRYFVHLNTTHIHTI